MKEIKKLKVKITLLTFIIIKMSENSNGGDIFDDAESFESDGKLGNKAFLNNNNDLNHKGEFKLSKCIYLSIS